MIARFIEDPPYIKNAKPGKLDSIGLGLLAIWLGCMQIILDRGQEDDWFGATWIRWAFVVMVGCFAALRLAATGAQEAACGPNHLQEPQFHAGLSF